MCEKNPLNNPFIFTNRLHYRGKGFRSIPPFLIALAFLILPGSFSLAYDKYEAVQNGLPVKYVTEDAVYLRGGLAVGLEVGQRLDVKRNPDKVSENPADVSGEAEPPSTATTIAVIKVVSVADSSAVCAIITSDSDIQPGDTAFLSDEDSKTLISERTAAEYRKYPQVITFTEDNPLEEEVRASVQTTKLPEINRMRGRLGVGYDTILDPTGAGINSRQIGIVARMDFTRIGGTYWDFRGYYRGRVNSRIRGSELETLTDLINRTYYLSLTYNNPWSNWVAGGGRVYLPWATSLGTLDGGYFGRKVGKNVTFGVFGGSSPDPTSWNYEKDRQLAGVFANFDVGRFESGRLTSTAGLALSGVRWKTDRQYGFFENSFFYKQYLSVFHNLEADLLPGSPLSGERKMALSRSYLTVRFQPIRVLSFNFSHNYFRNIPTFDSRLIGTGLVDDLLFQGFNGGVRFELPYNIQLYTNLGRSQSTTSENPSWNRTFGMSMRRILQTGMGFDFRYSNFDNTFGFGSYQSLTFSHEIGNSLRFNVRGGQQDFTSVLTGRNRSRWLSMDSDYYIGRHYVIGAGFTIYRGQSQEYDQIYVNLSYRF